MGRGWLGSWWWAQRAVGEAGERGLAEEGHQVLTLGGAELGGSAHARGPAAGQAEEASAVEDGVIEDLAEAEERDLLGVGGEPSPAAGAASRADEARPGEGVDDFREIWPGDAAAVGDVADTDGASVGPDEEGECEGGVTGGGAEHIDPILGVCRGFFGLSFLLDKIKCCRIKIF